MSFKLLPLAEEKSETIEVIKVEDEDKEREDDNDEEEEGGDVLSRLRSEKEGVKGEDEDEDEEEEEEVVAYTRRWTDSLKINRKKSKQEQEEKGKESSWGPRKAVFALKVNVLNCILYDGFLLLPKLSFPFWLWMCKYLNQLQDIYFTRYVSELISWLIARF